MTIPSSHHDREQRARYPYVPPGVTLPDEDDDTVLLIGEPGAPEFRERLEREAPIPIDTPPYYREAMLEFATRYGVYPPAYAMMECPERLLEFTALERRKREEFPTANCIELLRPYHDRIMAMHTSGMTPGPIARELNCDRDNLRAYLARYGT
jgi:hypothetical protein